MSKVNKLYMSWKADQKEDRVKKSKRTKKKYRQYKRFLQMEHKISKKYLRSIGLKDAYGRMI